MPPVGFCGVLRIRRRVFGRDLRLELGRIEREVPRLAQEDRDRDRAVGDDLRLVDRKARHRIDHFVAGAVVGHRRDRVGDERLRAARRRRRPRGGCRGRDARQVMRRRGAQLVDARRRRVAVLAVADGRDRGVLDVRRRWEVGLPDAERDDVLALPRQRVDLRQHDESVLGAERFGAARQRRQRNG